MPLVLISQALTFPLITNLLSSRLSKYLYSQDSSISSTFLSEFKAFSFKISLFKEPASLRSEPSKIVLSKLILEGFLLFLKKALNDHKA